jgi:hypothetical protein
MKTALPGWLLALFAISATALVRAQAGTTLTVSAQANIFGAGHLPPMDTPNPSGGSGGVPPVVFAFPPHAFRALTFTNVTGSVKMGNPTAPCGPDGGNFGYAIASYNGIAGIDAPVIGYLAGVFLDANEPTDPPPASLNFNLNALGRDFETLSPQIAQVFFIGDGLTASENVQEFIVPPTATRLFLGLADSRYSAGGPGYYHDNSGSFSVCVEALPIGAPNAPAASAALAAVSSPTHATTTAPAYVAPAYPVVLPKDSDFGYAIPDSFKLLTGIEYSPDLTHWSPLTNVSFFFKDLDSTNASQRFYRFPQ